MKNEKRYYECKHCKNQITFMKDMGVPVQCCGQPMELLVPNSVDAAQEKHVPALSRNGATLSVSIGSVEHPMLPEHYIEWISVIQNGTTQSISLSPGDAPHAEFSVLAGSVTVYAYCNLHGLWVTEMD